MSAASTFLSTGNLSTYLGGTSCRSSSECASGYACSGGKCVPINGSKPSADGTLSGCGGTGGGPCNSLTDTNVGVQAGGDASMVYGDVVVTQGGVSQGFYWEPVRSADGCTISGCKLTSCGGENGSDCPGNRYCRYYAGGVQCACGDPPPRACSSFCDAHHASTGETAGGCEGQTCDECQECDGNYFSSTYGQCIDRSGGPCHCDPDSLPPCVKCTENGTTETDTSCSECYTVFKDCSCGTVEKTCCYTLEELKNGLSGFNRCWDSISCDDVCNDPDKPAYVDPCEGDCTPQTETGPGTCPNQPSNLPDGHRAAITGCIEAGGNYTLLYNDCDMTNLPEECGFCDCNCHNDCPNCQLCGADGTCYPDPDPSCAPGATPTTVTITTTIQYWYEEYLCADFQNCSGAIVGFGTSGTFDSITTTTYADYQARYVDNGTPDVCDTYTRYRTPAGKSWYESGRRAIGGPIVLGHCPGATYQCPVFCNGNRISTWDEYSSSVSFS